MKVMTLETRIMGAVVLICGINQISATQFGNPFLYCWFADQAATSYAQVALVVLYIVALCLGVCLLVRRYMDALVMALFFIAIIELPRFADYFFRMGASCG